MNNQSNRTVPYAQVPQNPAEQTIYVYGAPRRDSNPGRTV